MSEPREAQEELINRLYDECDNHFQNLQSKLTEAYLAGRRAGIKEGAMVHHALGELIDWLIEDTLAIMKDTRRMGITFDEKDCQMLRDEVAKAELAYISYPTLL